MLNYSAELMVNIVINSYQTKMLKLSTCSLTNTNIQTVVYALGLSPAASSSCSANTVFLYLFIPTLDSVVYVIVIGLSLISDGTWKQ